VHSGDRTTYGISGFFLNLQDRWLMLIDLAVVGLALAPWWAGWMPRKLPVLRTWHVALLGVVVAIACYAGHYWLLHGYDLSRDEQMAVFDARIYGAGAMAWPIPRHGGAIRRRSTCSSCCR
jgi:phosphoglycerol transferase MdoB-like AlkP superfamily enzyme